MNLLGVDLGSSSVKTGILHNDRIVGDAPRHFFKTRHAGAFVDVDANEILRAVRETVRQLGPRAKKVDAIAFATMAPSWLAMDSKGKPLTPVVTHQDRRSVAVAQELEARVGKERHLKLAGNRPFPGGISSTTWAWYLKNEPQRLKSADLVGHISTFLHRHLTGARVTDPSNAAFMGLYNTLDLSGWNDELIDAVGAKRNLLPDVIEGNQIAGHITPKAAKEFNLVQGTPVYTSVMDGSTGVLFSGAKVGQFFNVIGSTDVLALCTDQPVPSDNLLTRPLGIGRKWLSVSTLAAAGSAIYWAWNQFYRELPLPAFRKEMLKIAAKSAELAASVRFDPYLAGERTNIVQRQGAFTGLTLSTNRDQMLAAIIESLAAASAARLKLMADVNPIKISRSVVVSGGAEDRLDKIMHRDWPGKWTYTPITEATLRGLSTYPTSAKA